MMNYIHISGYCPMGCGETLSAWIPSGEIRCFNASCPRETAVGELLSDPQTEHIVNIGASDFSLQHPLRERLDGELFDCPLNRFLLSLSGPPAKPGRYVARYEQTWIWEKQ